MKILSLALLAAGFSVIHVDALPGFPFPKNVITTKTWTYSTKVCSTALSTKACGKKVPTTIATKKTTVRPTIYKTITPTTYFTPTKILTVKSTVTITVAATITLPPSYVTETETASETSIISETTTEPSYVTITEEVTETTTIPSEETVTVPIPPGFRYPGPGVQPVPRKKREISFDPLLGKVEYNTELPNRGLEQRSYKKKYPAKVFCTVYVGVIIPKTSTRTAKTKTIFKPTRTVVTTKGAITLTATSWTTESPTITVDETATDSTSTTTTLTETTPSTVTQTVTRTETSRPKQTIYAACNSQNLVSKHPDGREIVWLLQSIGDLQFDYPEVTSAYDCCVACWSSQGCAGARYAYRPALGRWHCAVTAWSHDPQVCTSQSRSTGNYRYESDGQTYVINGSCGAWVGPRVS